MLTRSQHECIVVLRKLVTTTRGCQVTTFEVYGHSPSQDEVGGFPLHKRSATFTNGSSSIASDCFANPHGQVVQLHFRTRGVHRVRIGMRCVRIGYGLNLAQPNPYQVGCKRLGPYMVGVSQILVRYGSD